MGTCIATLLMLLMLLLLLPLLLLLLLLLPGMMPWSAAGDVSKQALGSDRTSFSCCPAKCITEDGGIGSLRCTCAGSTAMAPSTQMTAARPCCFVMMLAARSRLTRHIALAGEGGRDA